MKKIWVICGGPSSEFEVSLSSAKVVCERMNLDDKVVRPIIIDRNGSWIITERRLRAGAPADWLNDHFESVRSNSLSGMTIDRALTGMIDENIDCAVLVFHGDFGEDGKVQGFMETAGIPYTGSGVLASALAINKALTIDTYRMHDLPTAKSVRVNSSKDGAAAIASLKFPIFVKPVSSGSSCGMTLVADAAGIKAALDKAFAIDCEALVEEKIEGTEVSCGVLDLVENGEVVPRALSPTEIRPLEGEFFDYSAKYVAGKSKEITPAELPPDVIERIRACALKAHQVLGCEGMSRTDMIVTKEGEPILLETNTIPGLTPTSLLPQQCAAQGISFPQFIDGLIEHALFRYNKHKRVPASQA